MKYFFYIVILIPTLMFAQKTDSLKQRKFIFGINYSPDYCYRNFSQDSRMTDNFYTYKELPQYGYTAGLTLVAILNKRLNLETGILFSDKGLQLNQIVYNQINQNGPIELLYSSKIYAHNFFIDIPVKTNINLLTNRFKLYISTGVAINVLLGYKSISEISYPNIPTTNTTTINFNANNKPGFTFSLLLGLGASYDVTKKIIIKLEPIYRQDINSTIQLKSNGVLYSLGMNIGLGYRF